MAMLKRWSVTCLLVLASLPALGLALQQSPSPAPGGAAGAPLGSGGAAGASDARDSGPAGCPGAAAGSSPAAGANAAAGASPARSGLRGEGEGEGSSGSRPGGPHLGLQDPAARRGEAEWHGGQTGGSERGGGRPLHPC